MSDNSKIEWTDASWPVTVGCDHVSAGCDHCYAATLASGRLSRQPVYAGLAEHGRFNGTVRCLPERLDWPSKWRKPRRIFVCSMSDLFHQAVPDEFIAKVFAAMASSPRHTFQVLTKRHARMQSLVGNDEFRKSVQRRIPYAPPDNAYQQRLYKEWPLPNVWLGVSVEDQHWADIRIPALIETPAEVRFLSCEPLLGPVDLSRWLRGNVGKDGRREVALNDQERHEGLQERPDVGDAPDHPRAHGLPSLPLNAAVIPPDVTTHLLLQPADDFFGGAVDGHPRSGHPADTMTHAEIAFPVQKTGDIAEDGGIAGHPDRLAQQAGADSTERSPVGGEAPLHSRTRGAELGSDLGDGRPGGIRGLDLGNGQFDSTHSPHCINWLIVGGESGPGARPMHPDWARSLRDQCVEADVPFFFKQWGAHRWIEHSRYDDATRCWVADGIEPQRVSKNLAGRELDGCTWDQFPLAAERVTA